MYTAGSGAALSAIDYHELSVGHEFPRSTFRLNSRMIDSFRKAVEEPAHASWRRDTVPPMAVAAAALGALAERVNFPFGSIHLTQELDFKIPVMREERLTCCGKLLSRKDKRDIHLLTIGVNVYNQQKQLVMAGKTSFVLPRESGSDNPAVPGSQGGFDS
jgi:hypothetical protein